MCLAIPVRMVGILPDADGEGQPRRRRQEHLAALVDDVRDRRLRRSLHVGYALSRIDPARPRGRWPSKCFGRRRGGDMKYVDEYRDGALAVEIAATIAAEARTDRTYSLMEFCGGHTHAISRYGLEDLLPPRADDPRPRLPGLRAADGRIDLAIRLRTAGRASRCASTAT